MKRFLALSRLWMNKQFIEAGTEFEYDGDLPESLAKPLTPEATEQEETEPKKEADTTVETEYRTNEFIPYHLLTNAQLTEMISERGIKYPEKRNKDSLVKVLEDADREAKENDES